MFGGCLVSVFTSAYYSRVYRVILIAGTRGPHSARSTSVRRAQRGTGYYHIGASQSIHTDVVPATNLLILFDFCLSQQVGRTAVCEDRDNLDFSSHHLALSPSLSHSNPGSSMPTTGFSYIFHYSTVIMLWWNFWVWGDAPCGSQC